MSTSSLIGRDAELTRLQRAAAAAASGRSTVVALVGEYGLGKSALLDAVRADALGRGATVLSTQGRAADAELGFASLLSLLRPVEGVLDQLAGDEAPELRAALALGRRKGNPIAVRLATLRVLSALAAERPVVVLVDDVHLLDRASADVLVFAVGRLCADAVLTVVAMEPDAPSAFDSLAPETVTLEKLSDVAIRRIIAAAVEIAAEPVRHCVELAQGNPLAALELARLVAPAERLAQGARPAIPRLTGALAQAFAPRLERLSDACRNALAMVAADDTGDIAVIADALASLGEPDTGIAEAEAAGLLRTDGGTVRFTHPLIRPVAYHQVAAASRRVAHGALAAVLAGAHQGASRAWQMAAAAEHPDAAVASALALVATDIARRGGAASAARTMEYAASLTPAVEQRRDHLLAATRLWLDAGDAAAASRSADTFLQLPITIESVAVAAAAFRGVRPAAEVLSFVTRTRGAVEPEFQDGATAVLADELLAAGAIDDSVALADSLADSGGTPVARLAHAVLAVARGELAHAGESDDNDGPLEERAQALAAMAAADTGLPGTRPTTVAVGGIALDLAVSRAVAAVHAGEVADAHDQLLRLDAIAPDALGMQRARLDIALAEAELLAGRHDDAERRVTAVAERAAELGLGWLRGRAAWTLGRIALASGNDEHAVDHLRRACRVAPHLAAADFVTAAVAANCMTEAHSRAGRVRRFIGGDAPILDIRARRAIGALGSLAELYTAFDRAEAEGFPLEAAGAVMARAELAWQAGDLDVAKAAASDASNRFAMCGVVGWAPRLARLQRTTRDESAPPSIAEQLSPAEHRVALAVAEGRTNQEAAEALYLSVKTIDFHLQNIYRKLGLRSRTELAVLVQQRPVAQEVAS